MRSTLPILVLALLVTCGCNRTPAKMKQAIANAVKAEPNVVAFEKLFPGSEHDISYYTGEVGTPRWNSKALIHGRYILHMSFDIAIDRSGTKITATTPPEFQLVEVESITPRPSGQTEISYNTDSQREFGMPEWNTLVSKGG